jgi:hypothetical protein
MNESGRILFAVLRQREPGLEAKHRHRGLAGLTVGALRMGDPLPRQHPVHRAGLNPEVGPEAVAVVHPAFQEVGNGPEADVGVGADVDALAGQELGRAHLVEEDEGADHLPLGGGQRAADLEPAEVAGAGDDDGLDRVDLVADRDRGVEKRVPHGMSPLDRKVDPGGRNFIPISPRGGCAGVNRRKCPRWTNAGFVLKSMAWSRTLGDC